jgi:hypothetical protein
MGYRRGAYRVLVGRAEDKGAPRRPRLGREYNIKMDFKKWDGEA